MASGKSEITKRKALYPTPFDDIFEGFRRDMEDAFFLPGQLLDRRRDLASDFETRFPLCDMEDLGDKYEITLETPGIPKDKISVKAGIDYIDISGEQEKSQKRKTKIICIMRDHTALLEDIFPHQKK